MRPRAVCGFFGCAVVPRLGARRARKFRMFLGFGNFSLTINNYYGYPYYGYGYYGYGYGYGYGISTYNGFGPTYGYGYDYRNAYAGLFGSYRFPPAY